jgi:hypothetical protein
MVSFKKMIKQKKGIKLFRFDAFLDAVEMQKTAFICCQRNWKSVFPSGDCFTFVYCFSPKLK